MSCPHRADALLGEVDEGHLRTCAECTAAVRDAAELETLLGRATLPTPSAAALQRASAPVLAAMQQEAAATAAAKHKAAAREPALSKRAGFGWAVQAVAALAAFVTPLLFLHHRDASGWTAALVVLAAATVLAATAGTLRAGGLVVLAASAGFAVAEGGIPGFGAEAFHVSYACFAVELVAAALPLGAVLWMSRRNLRPGALAQAAAAGALAGQAALNLCCGVPHEAPHLWLFHVSGVAVAALVGWVLEGRLQASSAAS